MHGKRNMELASEKRHRTGRSISPEAVGNVVLYRQNRWHRALEMD